MLWLGGEKEVKACWWSAAAVGGVITLSVYHSTAAEGTKSSDSVIRSANIKAQSANCGQLMCYLDVMEFLTHCIAFRLLISDQDGCDVL